MQWRLLASPWLILAATAAVAYVWSLHSGVHFVSPQKDSLCVAALLLSAAAFRKGFGARSKGAAVSSALALWVATNPVISSATYLFASLNLPLIDDALQQADALIRFDWLAWFHYVNAHPYLMLVLGCAYASAVPQVALSALYFCHCDLPAKNLELWATNYVALLITAAVSGLLPAMGTFEHYGVADSLHGEHLHDLHALRNGVLHIAHLDQLLGIVTFPSYHVVMCVLLTWIYRGHGKMLRWIVPLNVLMLISIPSEGGHYLTDMAGGFVTALVSIWIVQRLPHRSGAPTSQISFPHVPAGRTKASA